MGSLQQLWNAILEWPKTLNSFDVGSAVEAKMLVTEHPHMWQWAILLELDCKLTQNGKDCLEEENIMQQIVLIN